MVIRFVLYSSRSIVRIVRFSPLLSVIVRTPVSLHVALSHCASRPPVLSPPAAHRFYPRQPPTGFIPASRHSHRLYRSTPAGLSSVLVRIRPYPRFAPRGTLQCVSRCYSLRPVGIGTFIKYPVVTCSGKCLCDGEHIAETVRIDRTGKQHVSRAIQHIPAGEIFQIIRA